MSDAFYHPLGDGRFAATRHTAGPWSAHTQHLGPPSALMVRATEALPAAAPMQVARVTVEILGPVPVAELEVSAGVERPGRSVELLGAELHADGRVVARCRAWRHVRGDTAAVAVADDRHLPPPAEGRQTHRPEGWGAGYLDAMEWRALAGDLATPGPATVWVRQGVDLVAGERPSGLQRLLVVADSGNGVSSRMDPREWLFINSELTVHLHREPTGDWLALDATTAIGPTGTGTAHTVLHDEQGPVGRGAQALLVRPQT
ncbi:thioesterase family protein [Actinophytocola xanthii]|uniref:TesB-like acyl-CoA thioesterase 5 n=1 Tax=Actinophytocola xanthii TaxID=1912961 RepID=A0A1Q8CUQ5_9PSEU|nr:thioesterase family protein [Actinophytocola xanthii]OLF18095.1 TesB-like acyl-CoA thioesterase 5 [Actinophytocola xanthii]